MFRRFISRKLPTFEELKALTQEVSQHRCAQSLGDIYTEMRHMVNIGSPRIIAYNDTSHGHMRMHFHRPFVFGKNQLPENANFYVGVLERCGFEVRKLTATKHKFSSLMYSSSSYDVITAYEILPPSYDDLCEPLRRNKKEEQDRIYKKLVLEYYNNIKNGKSKYIYVTARDYDEEVIDMMKKEGFRFSDTSNTPKHIEKRYQLDKYFPYPDSMEVKCMFIDI